MQDRTITKATILLVGMFSIQLIGQTRVRSELDIPDILGYRTLKCDFHMHTVFSDGDVWPPVRVEESWREGLDVISITDHLEHEHHKDEVLLDHNRAFELASSKAEQLDILLIRGAEITRDMPPGHLNCIFLKDAAPLDTAEWRDAIKAAIGQDAFVFWNHPGWIRQAPDGVAKWYDEHTEIYENGWMHGIEIVNETQYYPEVHQWCLEKKLTLFGNSDIHDPINLFFDFARGEHRAMTLVFATERTESAIKEALQARRTAVYFKNQLFGDETYLRPIFEKSIEILNPVVTLEGDHGAYVHIKNKADIPYELSTDVDVKDLNVPEEITLYGDKTVLFRVSAEYDSLSGERDIRIPYTVRNLRITPEEGLSFELNLHVAFIPAEKEDDKE